MSCPYKLFVTLITNMLDIFMNWYNMNLQMYIFCSFIDKVDLDLDYS